MKDHPANLLPTEVTEPVAEFFAQIPPQEPTEMYRVQMERQEPMVYMPFNRLNELAWELAVNIEKEL